jgi:hypothetical protein
MNKFHPAHPSTCFCPMCAADQLRETERLADEALARAGPAVPQVGTLAYEWPLAQASWARRFPDRPFPASQTEFAGRLDGWMSCPEREAQMDYQARERSRMLEAAREQGRQEAREGRGGASTDAPVSSSPNGVWSLHGPENGLSGAPDLCGASSVGDERYSEDEDLSQWAAQMADEGAAFAGVDKASGPDQTVIVVQPVRVEPHPRASKVALLPTGYQDRKDIPICTGVLDYFPLALASVAVCSRVANEQHNPGEPMHWAKEKSTDEVNTLVRHLLERGTRDRDGIRHSAKVAWRALANLQREIDADGGEL